MSESNNISDNAYDRTVKSIDTRMEAIKHHLNILDQKGEQNSSKYILLLEDYKGCINQLENGRTLMDGYASNIDKYNNEHNTLKYNSFLRQTEAANERSNTYAKNYLNFLTVFSAGALVTLIPFLASYIEKHHSPDNVSHEIYKLIGYFIIMGIVSLFLWICSYVISYLVSLEILEIWNIQFLIPTSNMEDEKKNNILRMKTKFNKIRAIVRQALEFIVYIICFASLLFISNTLYQAYMVLMPYF